jgi:hypothetical protein
MASNWACMAWELSSTSIGGTSVIRSVQPGDEGGHSSVAQSSGFLSLRANASSPIGRNVTDNPISFHKYGKATVGVSRRLTRTASAILWMSSAGTSVQSQRRCTHRGDRCHHQRPLMYSSARRITIARST